MARLALPPFQKLAAYPPLVVANCFFIYAKKVHYLVTRLLQMRRDSTRTFCALLVMSECLWHSLNDD